MSAAVPRDGEGTVALRGVLALLAAATLVPLWSVKYPPMVDLPQHAAQVFLWSRYFDPAWGVQELYELELFSPYLLAQGLARCFALLLPVPVAMKAMVSIAVLGLPLAMQHLGRQVGSDPWVALLGFPLAYGLPFFWGFTSYSLAVPLGLVLVAAGLAWRQQPTVRGGVVLAALALALYFCHALAFALCASLVGLLILAEGNRGVTAEGTVVGGQGWRRLARLWPLAPAGLLVVVWFLGLRRSDPTSATPPVWGEPFWERLLLLPQHLVGGGREAGGWLLGGLALAVLPWVGARPDRRRAGVGLGFAAALGLYLFAPIRVIGTWFVYPRLAIFAGAFALLAFRPVASERRRWIGRASIVAFILAWTAFLTAEFRVMAAEGRDFDAVLERMEPRRSVLGLIFEPGDAVGGLPVFGHFHMWYQAQKGGVAEYTFAMAYPQIVQYRPGAGPRAHPQLRLAPGRFDFARDGSFDYFLVRSSRPLGPRLFLGRPVELVERAGAWWLFRRTDGPDP